MAEPKDVLKRHKAELMRIPGVISVELTIAGGFPAIHVRAAPGTVLPGDIEGIPVVVTYVPLAPRRLVFTSRYRPIPMGVSVGPRRTIWTDPATGLRMATVSVASSGFYLEHEGRNYMVTAGHLWWHTLYEAWERQYGELDPERFTVTPLPSISGEPCFQPAIADGGSFDDRIGTLEKFVGLPFGPTRSDGCLVALSSEFESSLPTGTVVAGVANPSIGEAVVKAGRTTGIAGGVVTGIHADMKLYDPDTGLEGVIEDAFTIKADVLPGDSGGPVINTRGELLGILAAQAGSSAICVPAGHLVEDLGIKLEEKPRVFLPVAVAAAGVSIVALGKAMRGRKGGR